MFRCTFNTTLIVVYFVFACSLLQSTFGNLVTMEWWDDLWLNEGFASWAENWSADLLYPTYRMWDQFVTDHLTRALKLDGLQSSHPIQVPIQHAEEVEQVFDAISYCHHSRTPLPCIALRRLQPVRSRPDCRQRIPDCRRH